MGSKSIHFEQYSTAPVKSVLILKRISKI
jgi:hypothetical protein